MTPAPMEGAGRGPANTQLTIMANREAARHLDPEYWTRKTQADYLKNAKAFLQRGLLSAEGIEHFDTWKEDILRVVRSVLLIGRDHWATVNRLIATRLNEDVYQTVSSFVPENYEDLRNLNPTKLLQRIEARLVTADQLEFKRMRFELAKQTSSENPLKYENHLLSYYRLAQINDEGRFVDIYKKGIFNNKLRKLLLLHEPPLTLMVKLKAAVHHYQMLTC